MKQHTLLYAHMGEISYTPMSPVAVYEEGMVDLEETKSALYSSDDFRLTTVKKYDTGAVWLPDWMEPEEYLNNMTSWKWAWGMGANPEWPAIWQRSIAYDIEEEAKILVVIKLLKTKNFRSSFRQSLRNKLEDWLNTPREEREYDSPFSYKQWDALLNKWVAQEARQRGTALYNNNYFTGAPHNESSND